MSPNDSPPKVAVVAPDDPRYRVHSTLEIAKLLRALATQRALVTVYAGEHGIFFVTAVLAVMPEQDIVVLDYGVDRAATERLLRAPRLLFVTQLDHIRIQFSARSAQPIEYDHAPAFSIPFPESVIRLQRREFFRLKLPRGARRVTCEVTPEPAHPEDVPPTYDLTVYDMSCGGLALSDYPESLAPHPGMVLRQARLKLPDLSPVVADLEIVHVQGEAGPRRFGCRFVRTSEGAQTLIQRHLNRLERELKARA